VKGKQKKEAYEKEKREKGRKNVGTTNLHFFVIGLKKTSEDVFIQILAAI